jgi:hypothetical protein
MSLLPAFLRFAALGFVTVSALHLALGLNADVLLGAKLPPETVRDPVLDSQNRFYGVAFAIYGILLAVGAADLRRHALMLYCCFWCFFAGGLARLVSMALHGKPSTAVMALTATELFLPPLLALWLGRATRAG